MDNKVLTYELEIPVHCYIAKLYENHTLEIKSFFVTKVKNEIEVRHEIFAINKRFILNLVNWQSLKNVLDTKAKLHFSKLFN